MRKWLPLSASDLLGVAGGASLVFTIVNAGFGSQIAAAVAIITFIVVLILWVLSRVWQDQEHRFQLTQEQKGGEIGGEALQHITNSTNLILVTHFGTLVPSETYITHMLAKMDQGVSVIRIVGDNANQEKTKKWLKRFRSRQRYSEYQIPGLFMPFDFALCDGRILVLYLPSNAEGTEFNQALMFKNSEIALIFRGIFENLKLKGERTFPTKAPPPA